MKNRVDHPVSIPTWRVLSRDKAAGNVLQVSGAVTRGCAPCLRDVPPGKEKGDAHIGRSNAVLLKAGYVGDKPERSIGGRDAVYGWTPFS